MTATELPCLGLYIPGYPGLKKGMAMLSALEKIGSPSMA